MRDRRNPLPAAPGGHRGGHGRRRRLLGPRLTPGDRNGDGEKTPAAPQPQQFEGKPSRQGRGTRKSKGRRSGFRYSGLKSSAVPLSSTSHPPVTRLAAAERHLATPPPPPAGPAASAAAAGPLCSADRECKCGQGHLPGGPPPPPLSPGRLRPTEGGPDHRPRPPPQAGCLQAPGGRRCPPAAGSRETPTPAPSSTSQGERWVAPFRTGQQQSPAPCRLPGRRPSPSRHVMAGWSLRDAPPPRGACGPGCFREEQGA